MYMQYGNNGYGVSVSLVIVYLVTYKNIFVRFLVHMKSLKFAFEIYWPLKSMLHKKRVKFIFTGLNSNFSGLLKMYEL